MDKSNSTATYFHNTNNEYIANTKAFVKELKVCTQDPARYLQRCIAISTSGSYEHAPSYVTQNNDKEVRCFHNKGPLRNIYVSKSAFLSEKPDHGMITNMITSRAPGNFYSTQKWPIYNTPYHGVNTYLGGNYMTNPNAVVEDNKTETTENPKKLLLKMLQSTAISGKKRKSHHSKSKKRRGRKKKHLKSRRVSSQSNVNILKGKKGKVSEIKIPKVPETITKAVANISPPNVTNQTEKFLPKNNSMIHKMLEETEERLRITFLSNISCSSDASTTPTSINDLLEKSDMFQLVNSFISKLVRCASNMHMQENNGHSGNACISTTVARKSNKQIKRGLKNSQSRSSTISRRRDSNSIVAVRDQTAQLKCKTRQKKDRFSSVMLGRPGKDDTEEAELAHCTIQPDPPSAISAPYCETNSSKKAAPKSPIVQDVTPTDSDIQEQKPSNTSTYLERFRDPILDHGNKTKLLPEEYNSQITYVCASRGLNLKGNELDDAADNADKSVTDLSTAVHTVSDTSVKKPTVEKKSSITQSAEKKANIKANVTKAIGRMFSKSFAEKRSLQQRKVSDTRNKLGDTVIQAKQPLALRSNNKHTFKQQSERRLSRNNFKKAPPRVSSSYTSRVTRPLCQTRRHHSLPGKETIRLSADASAENRFFNRTEHLLFLARPNSRYVEDTKERYRNVLDPYHVRNLNTIIFCNQAEEQRLKKKREAFFTEAFILGALRERGSRNIFEDVPTTPYPSEAGSTISCESAHSILEEPIAVINLDETELLNNVPIQEIFHKSKLSIIVEEEPEDSEEADPFYVSLRKSVVTNIRICSDDEEDICNQTNVKAIKPTGSSEVESDYRVSDRFQARDVDEPKNEIDEENLFVLPNTETAYEVSEGPKQSTASVPATSDELNMQLYKPVEAVASNICTFITVFEGMQMTLKDIQQTCQSRTIICNRKYITQEEIEKDCSKALLKSSTYPEKCYEQCNSQHVMRCEVLFSGQALALGTKNCCNHNMDIILYHNSKPYGVTSGSDEKNDIWNKLITIHMNNTPFYYNVSDYCTTVFKTNAGMLTQYYIKDRNLVNSKTFTINLFANLSNNSVEYPEYNTGINVTERNTIVENIVSLLLVKMSQKLEEREISLYSAKNVIHMKSPSSEDRVIIDTSNPSFKVDGENCSSEVVSYTGFLQQKYAEDHFFDCESNISVIHKDNGHADVKESKQTGAGKFERIAYNVSPPKKIIYDFDTELSINKYIAASSKDTANNDKCLCKQHISPDISLGAAQGSHDNTIDKLHVYGSPSNNKDNRKLLINTLKWSSYCKTKGTKRSLVLNILFQRSKLSRKDFLDSEDSLSSDNVHRMVWGSSSEADIRNLICEPEICALNGKVAYDAITASSWHELTTLDRSITAGRSCQLSNEDEESACCSNQMIPSSLTLSSVDRTTQTDISIQVIPKRQNLSGDIASANVSNNLSSFTNQNLLSKNVKVVFLTFTCAFALYAASVLANVHTIKQVIQHLINTYIRPRFLR